MYDNPETTINPVPIIIIVVVIAGIVGIVKYSGTHNKQITKPQIQSLPIPQNIYVETLGIDNVTIKWDNAGKDISYQLYISKQNDQNRADPYGGLTTETSKIVYSLSSGTNYFFWVTSEKDGSESIKSSVLSVRTAQAPVQTSFASRSAPNNILSLNGTTWEYIDKNPDDNSGVRYIMSFSGDNAVTIAFYKRDGSIESEPYKGTYLLQGNNLTIEIVSPDKKTYKYTYSQSSLVDEDEKEEPVIYKKR